MNDMLSSFVEKIANLARAGESSERLGEGDSAVWLLPNGDIVKPWELRPDAPRFLEADQNFFTVPSFSEYVLRFRRPGTIVVCDPIAGSARAWIDYHEPDRANWRKHVATYRPQLSEDWVNWAQGSGKLLPQDEFAGLIERMERLILSPPAGQMMTIAEHLEGTMSVKWQRATNLQTGLYKMQWVQEGTTSTKAGDLSVPKKFSLVMPVLFGEQPIEVGNWLRIRIDNPLKIGYEIERMGEILQNAYGGAFASIKSILSEGEQPIPCFTGKVTE